MRSAITAVHVLPTAGEVATLLLDGEGRLPTFELFDCTIRGALLVDLASAGRLEQLPAHIEIDASASDVQLVDVLVGELTAGQQTIEQQVRSGTVTLADVARHLVAHGHWSRRGPIRRRFRVLDPSLLHLRGLSARSLQGTEPAVGRLLEASGVVLPPPKASWRTPVGAGDVEWLLETVVEVLRDLRERYEERTRVLGLNMAGSRPAGPFG